MRRMILATALVLLSVGAMAQTEPSYKDKVLEGYIRTGTRETCIPINSIKSTKILDYSNILFYTNGGPVYLNELPKQCGPLNRCRSITYSTSLSKLCNTDTVDIMDFGSSVPKLGTCGLRQFELLTEKKHVGQ